MTPEMQLQIEEQQQAFGALIVEPEGATYTRHELAGVPVEITKRSPSALNVKPYVPVWPLTGSIKEPSGTGSWSSLA